MNLREVRSFTITEKAPTGSFKCFQGVSPGLKHLLAFSVIVKSSRTFV